ncbi:hypothetical protein KUCAC02_004546, partial [Chaenocephalus aceratus]
RQRSQTLASLSRRLESITLQTVTVRLHSRPANRTLTAARLTSVCLTVCVCVRAGQVMDNQSLFLESNSPLFLETTGTTSGSSSSSSSPLAIVLCKPYRWVNKWDGTSYCSRAEPTHSRGSARRRSRDQSSRCNMALHTPPGLHKCVQTQNRDFVTTFVLQRAEGRYNPTARKYSGGFVTFS